MSRASVNALAWFESLSEKKQESCLIRHFGNYRFVAEEMIETLYRRIKA